MSSSTVRAYVIASREDLCLYLVGGRDRIFNNKNKNSTTTWTSTNRNDNLADRSKRMVRDTHKRGEEET